MSNLRIRRGERLKSKKTIENLFSGANTVSQFPLLLLWKEIEPNPDSDEAKDHFPIQFTPSVSKKKFKTAVDRNFIKRRIREAYRLNKNELYEQLGDTPNQLAFMIIFTGKTKEDTGRIDRSMKKLIRKFLAKKN